MNPSLHQPTAAPLAGDRMGALISRYATYSS